MPSTYVPPHARKMNNVNLMKPEPSKNTFDNNFPQLGNIKKSTVVQEPMNFTNLFKETDEPPKENKDELKKGYIKLTKNGIVYSLTEEEKEFEDTTKMNKIMSDNMKQLYINIEKKKQERMLYDSNYNPEIVIDEYSSSDSYTSDETEDYTEDPEDEFSEL